MSSNNPINIKTTVDLSGFQGFSAGANEAGAAAKQMAEKFIQSGLSAKEAEAALVNLGYAAKEAAAAAGTLAVSNEAATSAMASSTASMSGLERATAMAGARIVGMESGMGAMGYQIGRVAAYLPGLGELFAIALPIGIVVMAAEAFSKLGDEIRKQNEEAAAMVSTTSNLTSAIEMENLRLDDQIAKLELRPTENRLAEALIQAKEKADELGKSLSNDIEKSFELTEQDWLSKLIHGTSSDLVNFSEGVKDIFVKISDAKLQLSEAAPGSDAQKAALQNEIGLYRQLYQAATDVANVAADANQKARLEDFAASALNAANALQSAQEYSSKIVTVAGLEQQKAVTDFWAKYSVGFKDANDQLAKHDEFWKKFWAHQQEEQEKSVKRREEIDAEGQRHLAEAAARAQREGVEQNTAAATQAAKAVQESLAAMQAARESAMSGHAGTFAKIIGDDQSQKQIAQLSADIATITSSIDRLKADAAAIQHQPFLNEQDQKNVDAYKTKIGELESELQRLQQQMLRLKAENQPVWIQIRQNMEQSIDAGFAAFNSGFTRMLAGGESFRNVMNQLWNGMASSFINFVLRMGEEWVEQHVIMIAIAKLFQAVGLDVSGQIAANKAAAASAAGLAGANAVASFAAAP